MQRQTSRRAVNLMICAVFVLRASHAVADSWANATPRSYTSANGEFVFQVTPQDGKGRLADNFRPGNCRGELFKREHGARTLVWVRYLINNESPQRALVADTGAHVVTLNEWGRIGKLPVVVYGPKGELIEPHSLASLGLKEDRRHMTTSASSIWWDQKALIFFGPENEHLFLRFHWGRVVIIGLRRGTVVEKPRDRWQRRWKLWNDLRAYADGRVRELAMKKLEGRNWREMLTAIHVARQLKLAEALPRLRNLARDAGSILAKDPPKVVSHVQDMAAQALTAMGEAAGGK